MIARGDPPNRTPEVGATDLPKLDRPVSEETRRLYVENPRGLPQTLIPDDPPTFVFQSYAHDDARYVFDIDRRLRHYLATHPSRRFVLRSDRNILPGRNWLEELEQAMELADIALLFVSPAYLSSAFIGKNELPRLLEKLLVIPVSVKPVLFDGTMNLKGLAERQIYFDPSTGNSYLDLESDSARERFVRELFTSICELVGCMPKRGPVSEKGHSRKGLEVNE